MLSHDMLKEEGVAAAHIHPARTPAVAEPSASLRQGKDGTLLIQLSVRERRPEPQFCCVGVERKRAQLKAA